MKKLMFSSLVLGVLGIGFLGQADALRSVGLEV